MEERTTRIKYELFQFIPKSFYLIFRDRKDLKNVDVRSAKAEYDLAAELGLASKSQVVCRQRYSTCPFTADEMMKALRTANI